jgi:predicted nucleic acid-binding protein
VLVAMVDTNVFDAVADDEALRAVVLQAIAQKRLRLVTTPVQEEQLAAVPDPRRRKALRRLPREVVPAPPRPGDDYAAVWAGQPKHVADAVIADTARARCDVLVTEDKRLAQRAAERGLAVWDVDRLARSLACG